MASNTAVAAGGVSWQADIPGLASLALTLGRSGLKRLAQAGVDFHTLVCMSEIAEKCPASIEYRKEISECRQSQRQETQWVYKVVELGAGTNFVADELLKKRAGENVIALMSAVASVMSEKTCDRLFLKLFEAANADLDSTPGFSQLRAFRESLTPLAKRVDFKDRVFQYHVLSKRLLDSGTSSPMPHACEHIPSEETAVKVILALSKLIQEGSDFVLYYYGLPGSGWVIAYARHVLGLPVCVVSSPSNTVPISSDYQSAKVLVHIYSPERECKLLAHGNVQDYFITRPLDQDGIAGWQIDVGLTNLLDSYIPRSDPIRKVCPIIARSLTHRYTEYLAHSIGTRRNEGMLVRAGLYKYSVYCLPQVHQRAQKILTSFGFETHKGRNETWADYLTASEKDDVDELDWVPTAVWVTDQLGHIQSAPEGTRGSTSVVQFDDTGMAYIRFLTRLVAAASWLAFTDWDQNVGLLSTRFVDMMQYEGSGSYGGWWYYIKEAIVGGGHRREMAWHLNHLCQLISDMILSSDERRQAVLFPLSIAVHQQGVVFANNLALQQTFDFNACFLHVTRGRIQAHGEEKTSILAAGESRRPDEEEQGTRNAELVPPVRPSNMFPEISIRQRTETDRLQIYIVDHQVLINNEVFTISESGLRRSLDSLLITKECEHDYYDSYIMGGNDSQWIDELFQGLDWACALQLPPQHSHLKGKSTGCASVWFQAVDENPVGQWLASRAHGNYQTYEVLQRHRCISCTLETARQILTENTHQNIHIIHGRLEGESLNEG